jgi:hypothetical protein
MSVAGEKALLPLLQSTVVRYSSPESDSARRIETFVSAVKGVEFPLVTLNTQFARLDVPSFLHFSVIVGPTGFSDYRGPFQTPPLGGPLISRPEGSENLRVPIRTYRAQLSGTVDLQIDASEVPGQLKMPFVYSTPMGSA